MKKLVIMPGGFHPWHAGHTALYHAAKAAFPSADVFVAATADTANRPFPFKIKKLLAQAAGVPANRFIQVKSPFRAEEITQMYDPADTQLIFVRSEKDRDQPPRPGGIKKDGNPGYLQPYKRAGLAPFNTHAYMHYLPVAQFGPGMTSATEIRSKWPEMTPEQKGQLVKTIYPATANNANAVNKLIEILDSVMDATPVTEVMDVVATEPAVKEYPSEVHYIVNQLTQALKYIKDENYQGLHSLLRDPDLHEVLDSLVGNNEVSDSVTLDQDSDYAEER